MDIKAFYKIVDQNLRKSSNSLVDKFKLENGDLIIAVSNSDPMAVAESLKAWVSPNKPDGLDRYALPIAVENNNELIVGMLLYYKATPDVRAKDGESALYKATFWENEKIVRLLLDKGANPNFQNLDGKTAIQLANENGYKNILALLTNDKEHLKKMQLERDRATHIALKERALKAKGKKLNRTLADSPAMAEKSDAMEEQKGKDLLQAKYVEYSSPFLALIAAIKAKDSAAVRSFSAEVKDLNVFENGENPMQIAIEGGKEKLATYLHEQGASIFLADESGNYPLLNACVQHQMYDLLNASLKNEENAKDKINATSQSFSPQFLAYKDPKMMDLLLKFGADPFFGGKDGVSPIVKAIEKGSVAILPVLSKHNIAFDQKMKAKSLIEWAVEFERADWVNGLLMEKSLENASEVEIRDILNLAKSKQNTEILDLLKNVK